MIANKDPPVEFLPTYHSVAEVEEKGSGEGEDLWISKSMYPLTMPLETRVHPTGD